MRARVLSITVVCLSLFLGCVGAYWTVLSCDFVNLDDVAYVSKNRNVLNGLSLSGWIYAWTTHDCFNWHPLTWLSLELDASLWGGKPAGFHATNLILHALNSILVFVVLFQLTTSLNRSACVAAFFAVHPLHVESVAWISERKDVLSTLFLLLTILAYVSYAIRLNRTRYFLVLALLTSGLLAKPMLVTLPILLLLLDMWPMNRVEWIENGIANPRFPRRSPWVLLLEKVPLLGVAFVAGLITLNAQRGSYQVLQDVELPARIANMFSAYFWYLRKTIIPTNLTVIYPHPESEFSWSLVGAGILVTVGISLWSLWRRRVATHLLVGWFWFVISLLPVIGLIQVGAQAYADRYSYIPHIGLFIAMTWEVHAWMANAKTPRIIGAMIVMTALVTCGILTHSQVGYWKNQETLFTHALEATPDNIIAHYMMAQLWKSRGDVTRAAEHFEQAFRSKRMQMASPDGYVAWGECLSDLGRLAEAEDKYQQALKLNSNYEFALQQMVTLLQKQGRHSEALPYVARYEKSRNANQLRNVKKNPYSASSQLFLGIEQSRRGNVRQAMLHFENAVRVAPQSVEALNYLAYSQKQLNRLGDAKANYTRAIQLKPDLADAHFNLGQILETEKDFSGARKHFEEAIRLNPSEGEVKKRLDQLPR